MRADRRKAAIGLIVVGIAAFAFGMLVVVRAQPSMLSCARTRNVCTWDHASLLGTAERDVLPIASLSHSRIEVTSSSGSVIRSWMVTGPAEEDIDLGEADVPSQEADFLKEDAALFEQYLEDPGREVFGQRFDALDTRPFALVIVLGLALAGLGFFQRRGGDARLSFDADARLVVIERSPWNVPELRIPFAGLSVEAAIVRERSGAFDSYKTSMQVQLVAHGAVLFKTSQHCGTAIDQKIALMQQALS